MMYLRNEFSHGLDPKRTSKSNQSGLRLLIGDLLDAADHRDVSHAIICIRSVCASGG
jgi:hypothetical protein